MILKVKTNCGWQVFGEIDYVHYTKGEDEGEYAPGVLDYTANWEHPMPSGNKMFICFMNKNQTAETSMLAYSPVYLMNDEGRTVETI